MIEPDSQLLLATAPVLRAVARERIRQQQLRLEGKFTWTPADDDCPNSVRLACIAEEFGEVGKALLELAGDVTDRDVTRTYPELRTHLRAELVQLAALAVAWAEALDAEGAG